MITDTDKRKETARKRERERGGRGGEGGGREKIALRLCRLRDLSPAPYTDSGASKRVVKNFKNGAKAAFGCSSNS